MQISQVRAVLRLVHKSIAYARKIIEHAEAAGLDMPKRRRRRVKRASAAPAKRAPRHVKRKARGESGE